ncbi:MAG TPA: alpha/beta hydrolase [Steroidobacteraceae bacterium]|jgi:pimeloyl-ACP methyl ester carboxylesterase
MIAVPPSSATPDHYLPVAGALLRYRDEGSGPPVLLIHGWTLDLDMWEPQVTGLGDSFRLVRFDRRGFGLSSGRAALAADTQDALTLCDKLQLERLACLGMSQGARVALHLCRIAPERLSCLILDGPPRVLADASAAETEDVPLPEYRGLIAGGEIETFRRRWASHPLMQLQTQSVQPRNLLQRMTARYSGNDLLQELPAPEDHWDRAVAASLRAPALIVTGEHDLPPRLRAADALSEALPGAQRASICAARHIPNLDNPLMYNAVLRAFLERHAG